MQRTLYILSIILFVIFITAIAEGAKLRLPDAVNRYQQITTPVLSPDSRAIFFVRKLHPMNTGGVYDTDDVWVSELGDDGVWANARLLPDNINTPGSDVLFSISPDGNTGLIYGKYTKDVKKQGLSIININMLSNTQPIALHIPGYYNLAKNYSACISADANTLIMAIEKKDSYGQLDLYISYRQSHEKWSVPKNMGAVINSSAVETSPYLAPDGRTLYFSSSRPGGHGLLDIYMSRLGPDGWSEPVALECLNSTFNESSFTMSALCDTVYYVSSDTSRELTGIYLDTIPTEYRPGGYKILHGNIFTMIANKETKVNVPVKLSVASDITSEYYTIGNSAEYRIALPTGHIYLFSIEAEGYSTTEFSLDLSKADQIGYIKRNLKIIPAVRTDGPLATVYFENNSSELSLQAENSIIEALTSIDDLENIKLLATGHADESGGLDDNQILSENRCKSVMQFLVSLGVDRNNIKCKPMGETMPASRDLNLNRRVEISVVE